jgi:DNA-directed RNA polymerase subunit L
MILTKVEFPIFEKLNFSFRIVDDLPSWDEIIQRAVASMDEHLTKLGKNFKKGFSLK